MGDEVAPGHQQLEVGEVRPEGLTREAHACERSRDVFLVVIVRSLVVSFEGAPEHLFDRMTAILRELIERDPVLPLVVTRCRHPAQPFESAVGSFVKPQLFRRAQQVFE